MRPDVARGSRGWNYFAEITQIHNSEAQIVIIRNVEAKSGPRFPSVELNVYTAQSHAGGMQNSKTDICKVRRLRHTS